MKDTIKKPTLDQSLSCISKSYVSWKAKPHDPYIYVSFSLQQLEDAYVNNYFDPYYLIQYSTYRDIKNKNPYNFDESYIRKYSKLLKREWIDRADFPIRILDGTESKEEIRGKNVVFVIGGTQDKDTRASTKVVYARHNDFKIIFLKQTPDLSFSQKQIHEFLHETGHAFIDLKHMRQKQVIDRSPYCELECTESVIAYEDDCSTLLLGTKLLAKLKKNNPSYNGIGIIKEAERQGITLEAIYKEVMPTRLTELDIKAAQLYLQNWQIEHALPARIGHYFIDKFDNALDRARLYAQSVVDACPSYFCPDDITKPRPQINTNDELLSEQPIGSLFLPMLENDINQQLNLSNHHAGLFVQAYVPIAPVACTSYPSFPAVAAIGK